MEPLLDKVLGEDIEVELLAGDSGFESRRVLDALEARAPAERRLLRVRWVLGMGGWVAGAMCLDGSGRHLRVVIRFSRAII